MSSPFHREAVTAGIAKRALPAEDFNAYSLARELKEMLNSIKDEGTAIDSGGGAGGADLWVKVQGVEYAITIRPPSTTS